ncbi:hypothetical protein [Achromobacter mucicolens]|uniref:hypothetical protein n=1 Tax=Achromobacter mucicolens TaxID=1389922 RepID=UPI002FDFA973
MPLIPFPNVPQVPGVPAVFRDLTIPSLPELVNLGLGGLADLLFGTPLWGMYDQDGRPALVFDAFLGVRFRNGGRISSFPVEQGGFSSFNKVDTPYDAAIRLAHSGDMASRNVMLSVLERIVRSTDLYSVVTPEIVYASANLVNYAYTRDTRGGSSQLIVELYLEEVRQTAVAQFTETEEPSGSDPQSNGQVQSFPLGTEPGEPLILTTEFQ